MKRTTVAAILLICSMAGAGCATEHYAQRGRGRFGQGDTLAPLTTQDIITLTRGGIGKDVILSLIDVSGSRFRLRTAEVMALADSGVSDTVINAMIKTEHQPAYADRSVGYSWSADFPFWYPWYAPWYFGFSAGFHRPYFAHRTFAPMYGYSGHNGFSRGGGFGGARSGGRRR